MSDATRLAEVVAPLLVGASNQLRAKHPSIDDLFSRSLPDLDEFALMAVGKIMLMVQDSRAHSVAVMRGEGLMVAIHTIPVGEAAAREWYWREWNGYTKFWERLLNAQIPAEATIYLDFIIGVQIVEGSPSCWVTTALLPLRRGTYPLGHMELPGPVVTDEEVAQFRLALEDVNGAKAGATSTASVSGSDTRVLADPGAREAGGLLPGSLGLPLALTWAGGRDALHARARELQIAEPGPAVLARTELRPGDSRRHCLYRGGSVAIGPLGPVVVCEWSVSDDPTKQLCYQPCLHNLTTAFAIEAWKESAVLSVGAGVLSLAIQGICDFAPVRPAWATPAERGGVYLLPGYHLAIPGDEPTKALGVVDDMLGLMMQHVSVREMLPVLELAISGYDQDPRELWEIPEVVEWARSVRVRRPEFIAFLAPESMRRFGGLCHPGWMSHVPQGSSMAVNLGEARQLAVETLDALHVRLLGAGVDAMSARGLLLQASHHWVDGLSGARNLKDYVVVAWSPADGRASGSTIETPKGGKRWWQSVFPRKGAHR